MPLKHHSEEGLGVSGNIPWSIALEGAGNIWDHRGVVGQGSGSRLEAWNSCWALVLRWARGGGGLR